MKKFLIIVLALFIVSGVGTASLGETKAKPECSIEKVSYEAYDAATVDTFNFEILEAPICLNAQSTDFDTIGMSSIIFTVDLYKTGPPVKPRSYIYSFSHKGYLTFGVLPYNISGKVEPVDIPIYSNRQWHKQLL